MFSKFYYETNIICTVMKIIHITDKNLYFLKLMSKYPTSHNNFRLKVYNRYNYAIFSFNFALPAVPCIIKLASSFAISSLILKFIFSNKVTYLYIAAFFFKLKLSKIAIFCFQLGLNSVSSLIFC